MQTTEIVVSTEEVAAISTGHSTLKFVAPPEVTGTRSLTIMQGTVQAGDSIHLHSHQAVECFYILAGEMELYEEHAAPNWKRVKAGDVILLHSNVRHAWRNVSSALCECLIITDADVFRFLQGASGIRASAQSGGMTRDEAMQQIASLATETHYALATPEENTAIGLPPR